VHEHFHELSSPAQGCNGISAGESLAVDDEVRPHSRNFGDAAEAMAKASLDFIEGENEAIAIGQAAQSRQVTRLRMDNTNVLQDRLGNQPCNGILLADILD
jgi:hypothetical protein